MKCPVCKQPARYLGQQRFPTSRTVLTLADCVNPECRGFRSTHTVAERPMTDEEAAQLDRLLRLAGPLVRGREA